MEIYKPSHISTGKISVGLSLLLCLSAALLLLFSLSACNTTRRTAFHGPRVTQKISHHHTENPSAVTLILHGLNVNPDRMESLIRLAEKMDQDVFVLRLTGHRGDPEAFKQVTRLVWLQDIEEAYHRAKKHASKLNVPFYFIGYSLGGLLMQDFLSNIEKNGAGFDKQVLFAPALSLNWYAHAIKSAFIFHDGIYIPSLAPRDYSANKKIPVAAYKSLFASFNALHERGFDKLNVPTLIFVNRKDELVSARGMQKLVEDQKLTEWQIIPVDTQHSTRRERYNHIIIEEAAVGKKEWKKITTHIQNFLQASRK